MDSGFRPPEMGVVSDPPSVVTVTEAWTDEVGDVSWTLGMPQALG